MQIQMYTHSVKNGKLRKEMFIMNGKEVDENYLIVY